MKLLNKYTVLLIISILLISTILMVSIFIIYNNLNTNYKIVEPTIIEISKGDSDITIFNKLQKSNLINNSHLHHITFRLIKKIKPQYYFKSGEYNITSQDNYFSLIKKIINGSVYHRRFTITEGQTIHEVITALQNNNFFSGEINTIPTEGGILPETYFFKKNTPRQEQLNIMKKNMQVTLDKAWLTRDPALPLKNKYELLILASIVEKETGKESERNRIAGVFFNRLKKGMKLQSDPTVIYAITNGQYKLARQLSKRDLLKKSPYNTYVNFSLPPAPKIGRAHV